MKAKFGLTISAFLLLISISLVCGALLFKVFILANSFLYQLQILNLPLYFLLFLFLLPLPIYSLFIKNKIPKKRIKQITILNSFCLCALLFSVFWHKRDIEIIKRTETIRKNLLNKSIKEYDVRKTPQSLLNLSEKKYCLSPFYSLNNNQNKYVTFYYSENFDSIYKVCGNYIKTKQSFIYTDSVKRELPKFNFIVSSAILTDKGWKITYDEIVTHRSVNEETARLQAVLKFSKSWKYFREKNTQINPDFWEKWIFHND